MILKNKKTQKFVSSLLVIFILAPSVIIFTTPKKTEAQFIDAVNAALNQIGNVFGLTTATTTTTTLGLQVKTIAKEIYKEAKMVIARRLLAEMTKSTINWINTGDHGNPLFLTNSNTFFRDIAKSEVKSMVNRIGYDRLKFPFGRDFALQTIQSVRNQADTNAEYSLSRVINDPVLLERYRNNFYIGGWDGFLINTQYPQNNYLGFQLLASDVLGQKLEGTAQSTVEKVKDQLNQGMGFLSPQICPSNPEYDNSINPNNRPSFSFKYDIPAPSNDNLFGEEEEYAKWEQGYYTARTAALAAWNRKNVCPGGPVTTTPGSVAASQIMKTLGVSQDQATFGAALGSSMSAIFDTLIARWMNQGLSTLESNINPKEQPDDWSYEGLSLGSEEENINGNGDPFSGPDEEIILEEFKNDVAEGISNIRIDMALLDNGNVANPGILQLLKLIPINTQTLDQCLPGPDKGWEARLDAERDRIINSKLVRETSSEDDRKVKAVNSILRDLRFAVSSFKDWLNNKIITSLPNAIIYEDAVKELDDINQQNTELTKEKRTKTQTLTRLQSIEKLLNTVNSIATNTNAEQQKLISAKKQYEAIRASLSTAQSIEDTRNTLNSLKDKLANLSELNTECENARADAGWGPTDKTGRGNSILASASGKTITIYSSTTALGSVVSDKKTATSTGSEIEQFCGIPIVNGYSHGDILFIDDSNRNETLKFAFRNQTSTDGGSTPGYEDLPMVNAFKVYGDQTGKFTPVDVDIECTEIFRANKIDYTHAGDPAF